MTMQEHITHCQKLLEQHGDHELALEFATPAELWTVDAKGITDFDFATLQDGKKVFLLQGEVYNNDESDD